MTLKMQRRDCHACLKKAIAKVSWLNTRVFSRDYQAIKQHESTINTATLYDAFSDRHFSCDQERIRTSMQKVHVCGARDLNGYFPTHNKKFSPADKAAIYEKDLITSQLSGIFNDSNRHRCVTAQHTVPFFNLQTYKRDTGEKLLH